MDTRGREVLVFSISGALFGIAVTETLVLLSPVLSWGHLAIGSLVSILYGAGW